MSRVYALLAVFCILTLSACTQALTSAPSGELSITMITDPAAPVAGAEATLVFAVTQGGQPLVGARVLVVRRMLGVVHADDDIVFESADLGGGAYSAVTSFATAGAWDVQVVVTPAVHAAAPHNVPMKGIDSGRDKPSQTLPPAYFHVSRRRGQYDVLCGERRSAMRHICR